MTHIVTLSRTEIYTVYGCDTVEEAQAMATDQWHVEDDAPEVVDITVSASVATPPEETSEN